MNPIAQLINILLFAIKGKRDERTVQVQKIDAIMAIGFDAYRTLTGETETLEEIQERLTIVKEKRLLELRNEKKELRDLAAAGVLQAKQRLKDIDQLYVDVQSGRAVPKALCSVNVKEWRLALEQARERLTLEEQKPLDDLPPDENLVIVP